MYGWRLAPVPLEPVVDMDVDAEIPVVDELDVILNVPCVSSGDASAPGELLP
jgi:hypothetical protein